MESAYFAITTTSAARTPQLSRAFVLNKLLACAVAGNELVGRGGSNIGQDKASLPAKDVYECSIHCTRSSRRTLDQPSNRSTGSSPVAYARSSARRPIPGKAWRACARVRKSRSTAWPVGCFTASRRRTTARSGRPRGRRARTPGRGAAARRTPPRGATHAPPRHRPASTHSGRVAG